MSRVRQFGDLRNSRFSRNASLGPNTPTARFDKAESTHSHYVCVNCVNRSMSNQKQQLRASRRNQQNSELLQLEKSRNEYELKTAQLRARRIEEEKQKVLKYNINVIKSCEQRKQAQKNKKAEDKKQQQLNLQQYQKKIQQDKRREALLKDKWRQDIQKQIQLKSDRIHKQRQECRQPPPVSKEEQRNQQLMKNQTVRLEKYRNDLLNQIKEDQLKKEKLRNQKNMEKDITNFVLLDRAEERARKFDEIQRERKKKMQEERNAYEIKMEKQRLDERQKLEKQKTFQKATKEREEQRIKQIQKRRDSQIQEYIAQIKQQMNDRERRRRNEMMLNRTTLNEPFIKDRQVDSRLCDSCERPFPKAYMTKVKDE